MLAASPGFTVVAVAVAGDRHRRQLRHLQLRGRAAAAAASGRPAGRGLTVGSMSSVEAFGRELAASRPTATTSTSAIATRASRASARSPIVTAAFAIDASRDAEAEDGHAGQRQPASADGRRAGARPRRSGPTKIRCRPRRRRRLGHTMWEQEFGVGSGRPRPHACGSTATTFTVIGVAPDDSPGWTRYVRVRFLRAADDVAARSSAIRRRRRSKRATSRNLTLKGRLKPGVSQAEAQSGADGDRARTSSARIPETNKNRQFVVRTELQARIAQDPPDATLIAMLVDARARPCCSSRARTSPDC